jgi:hypothetical protein
LLSKQKSTTDDLDRKVLLAWIVAKIAKIEANITRNNMATNEVLAKAKAEVALIKAELNDNLF